MALHDYQCPRCGAVREVNVPIAVGAAAHPEWCADHGAGVVRMVVVPAIRISGFSDGDPRGGRSDFAKFSLPVEDPGAPGGFRTETIGSLADIRRLERESAQRERNGEGRRMVWRDYSQDSTHRDQHTLGADPSLTPGKTYVNGTPVRVRRGDPVIADHGEVPQEAEP